MEKKQIFKGDFFVIPNLFERYESSSENPWWYGRFAKEMSNFGIALTEGEYLVQIWATGSGSDNWQCHGNMELCKFLFPEQSFQNAFKALEELRNSYNNLSEDEYEEKLEEIEKLLPKFRFPSYLPLKVLENLKEGESIRLSVNGKEVELVAKQLTYRYRRSGSFQEVIQNIKNKSDSFYERIDEKEKELG